MVHNILYPGIQPFQNTVVQQPQQQTPPNNSTQINTSSYYYQQLQLQQQFNQNVVNNNSNNKHTAINNSIPIINNNNNTTTTTTTATTTNTQNVVNNNTINNNQAIIVDGYLTKLYDKFQNFQTHHLGVDNVNFDKYPLPNSKECRNIEIKIQYQQHIHTSTLPFMLPNEIYQPPKEFTKVDVVQYYIDGITSLLVLKSQIPSNYEATSKYFTTLAKRTPIFIAKCIYLIDKLSQSFQEQQVQQSPNNNRYSSSTNCNNNSNTNTNNNPIINHFKKEIENIKQQVEKGLATNETRYYFSKSLFSLLTSKGYFWNIDQAADQVGNNQSNVELSKIPLFEPIRENLCYLSNTSTQESVYKYSFGCYCFSFFKIYHLAHGIDSNRFINFKSTKSFDERLYNILYLFLKQSNDLLLDAFNQPISLSVIWLTYAKTCCLLDYEEKAHTWIQYFINEATDRIKAFEIINNDSDISHYRSKSWYVEIKKSIEEEKNRIINEQLDKDITLFTDFNQYLEIKQNLILEGFAVKNMNQDSSLISSNILMNLHPPPQSEVVKIAQQRLSERLELYMLKNSKEIPGDGNCQFHALSDQLYGDLSHSHDIRKTIVHWLRKNKDFALPNGANLSQFVGDRDWNQYCNEMEKLGNWGDHLTLLAAAEIYGCKISIISSVESTSHFFIDVIPTKIQKDKVLLLSHYAEFHYGSLCFNF